MRGHLILETVADLRGQTIVAKQSVQAPMHLSKPYWDGEYLIVQAVNCTAGMFSGDEILFSVSARARASTVVTSPSASRVFRARSGEEPARLRQEFHVGPGAWLEFCPEVFIPHRGCRASQRTHIDVEEGGGLLFIESFAPGRVASGEAFLFEQLDWHTEVHVADHLLARERYMLSPGNGSLTPLREIYPTAYYSSAYLVSPALRGRTEVRAAISALAGDDGMMAASFLGADSLAVKILAPDSIALRRCLARLREYCYTQLNRPLPHWRKL